MMPSVTQLLLLLLLLAAVLAAAWRCVTVSHTAAPQAIFWWGGRDKISVQNQVKVVGGAVKVETVKS